MSPLTLSTFLPTFSSHMTKSSTPVTLHTCTHLCHCLPSRSHPTTSQRSCCWWFSTHRRKVTLLATIKTQQRRSWEEMTLVGVMTPSATQLANRTLDLRPWYSGMRTQLMCLKSVHVVGRINSSLPSLRSLGYRALFQLPAGGASSSWRDWDCRVRLAWCLCLCLLPSVALGCSFIGWHTTAGLLSLGCFRCTGLR